MASSYKKAAPPSGEIKRPDQEALDQCLKDLCAKKAGALSLAKAAETARGQKLEVRQYKVCGLLKTEETLTLYHNIDYSVSLEASTSSEIIKKSVEGYIKKSGDLEAALKGAAQTLKSLKEKLNELKAAACSLDTCIKDSCNAEQMDILTDNVPNFEPSVRDLITKANTSANDGGATAFMTVVDTIGIQSFSNVESLMDMCKSTADRIKEFKADIDANVKDREKEIQKAHEDLNKSTVEDTTKKLEAVNAIAAYEGAHLAVEFICDTQAQEPEFGEISIKEICEKVKNNLRGTTNGPLLPVTTKPSKSSLKGNQLADNQDQQ